MAVNSNGRTFTKTKWIYDNQDLLKYGDLVVVDGVEWYVVGVTQGCSHQYKTLYLTDCRITEIVCTTCQTVLSTRRRF